MDMDVDLNSGNPDDDHEVDNNFRCSCMISITMASRELRAIIRSIRHHGRDFMRPFFHRVFLILGNTSANESGKANNRSD
jgi:hypothetical protein